MKDLSVTKRFVEKENPVTVYGDSIFHHWMGFWVGLFGGGFMSLPFITSAGLSPWYFTLIFGLSCLAGLLIGVISVRFHFPTKRLRVIKRSIFGPTLNELYTLYCQIDKASGVTSEEKSEQLKTVERTMRAVWIEGHRLIGLVLGETPSLERAQELLDEFKNTQEALKELNRA